MNKTGDGRRFFGDGTEVPRVKPQKPIVSEHQSEKIIDALWKAGDDGKSYRELVRSSYAFRTLQPAIRKELLKRYEKLGLIRSERSRTTGRAKLVYIINR